MARLERWPGEAGLQLQLKLKLHWQIQARLNRPLRIASEWLEKLRVPLFAMWSKGVVTESCRCRQACV